MKKEAKAETTVASIKMSWEFKALIDAEAKKDRRNFQDECLVLLELGISLRQRQRVHESEAINEIIGPKSKRNAG